MINEKQIYYFLAVKEILELFAEQELGSTCEIDVEKVLGYIQSMKFVADTFEIHANKEEIFQLVTDDILAGYPVWQLLKMSDWTRNMLEKEYTIRREQEKLKLVETYKCFSCKFFEESETDLGMLRKCNRPRKWTERREAFTPKKKCRYFEEDKE